MDQSHSADVCTDCGAEVGLKFGKAPFFDGGEVFCARCSGRHAVQCAGCGVAMVDIGIGTCPYCTSGRLRDL